MDKFSALADPTRRQIIEQLAAKGTLNASQLGQPFTMSAPAISQHLKVLREAEVVIMHKQGQQRLYTINPTAFNEMEQWLHQVRQFWNDSFAALDTMLARNEKASASKRVSGKTLKTKKKT